MRYVCWRDYRGAVLFSHCVTNPGLVSISTSGSEWKDDLTAPVRTWKASCSILGHTSWNGSVEALYRSKWCRSSICSRLMGPHSASKGHQADSDGGDVSGGDSLPPPAGRRRAEADAWFLALDAVPARVTFVALHRRLEVSIYTPAVSGGRKEAGSHTRRTFTLRLLHLIHPSLDFWNPNRLVPVLFPHRATHFPTKDLDLAPTWTVI